MNAADAQAALAWLAQSDWKLPVKAATMTRQNDMPRPPTMSRGRRPRRSMTNRAGKVARNMLIPTTPEARSETVVDPMPKLAKMVGA